MANTIKTTSKIDWLDESTVARSIPLKVHDVETTSDVVSDLTQVVGTTHELVSVGDVTDDAMLIVENLHATALVQLGTDDTGVFTAIIDIPATHPRCVIPQVSTLANLYIKSSVSSTPVRVAAFKIAS
jgi:hypothetical protein